MKLCLLSDCHTYHREIDMPVADLYICAGDYSMIGDISEVKHFLTWFSNLPNKKLLINGNHEVIVSQLNLMKPLVEEFNKHYFGNITYLENSGVEIDGLKFWGSPYSLAFGSGWAYQLPHTQAKDFWEQIPSDTDVLVTHGPAYGHGDVVEASLSGRAQGHLGCKALLARVEEIAPKLVVAGHIHSGQKVSSKGKTLFINASICTEDYSPDNAPIVVDTESWKVIDS